MVRILCTDCMNFFFINVQIVRILSINVQNFFKSFGHPVSPPSKFEAKWLRDSRGYDRTLKQTEITTFYIYFIFKSHKTC